MCSRSSRWSTISLAVALIVNLVILATARGEPSQDGKSAQSQAPQNASRRPAAEGLRIGAKDPSRRASKAPQATGPAAKSDATASLATLATSLALVLGLLGLTAWTARRWRPAAMRKLPKEAVQILGHVHLGGRHSAVLIGCGNKVVLTALSPDGARPLVEVADQREVEFLRTLCLQTRPESATSNFRQLVGQFARSRPDAVAGHDPRDSAVRHYPRQEASS